MKSYHITTLNDFIIQKQKDFPFAKGELSSLLHHIGIAAKMVNKKINKAGLIDIIGRSGDINIQGEEQQRLDVYADEVFINALLSSGECCGVATEENENEIVFSDTFASEGKYVVCLDPLDGSSNIDYNVSVGSIFSIYRRITPRGEKVKNEDFLQEGNRQVAAGYILKGGIFLYPENETAPKGKLRLVYECNPIAFIAIQAGGIASNGRCNILDITPASLHQRSPFYAGSKNMVNKVESLLT